MPFLAAIPAALSAFGVAVPSAVGTGLAAATGALGLAQGIAKKDPLQAIMGAAGGAIPGLSNAGVFGQAAQGVSAPTSIGSKAGSVAGTAMQVGQHGKLLQNIAQGISAVGSATQGVMGLINAFKSPDTGGHGPMLGGLNFGNLPVAGGAQVGNLPTIQPLNQESPARTPEFDISNLRDNTKLLQLLGAYQT